MNCKTGEIIQPKLFETLEKTSLPYAMKNYKRMGIEPTRIQMSRKPPKIGRNEPCGCGSGIKFKNCCYISNPKMGL